MAIYLPQQPTFMDQFLGTGVMNNVMKAMMMRMQNQRADKEYAQGLQEKGYTEIQDPSTYKADEYIDTTPKTLPMPRQTGPQQWVPPQKPDVTVGGGRGLMGTPKRGFKRPAVPKPQYFIEKEGNRELLVMRSQTGTLLNKPTVLSPEKSTKGLTKGRQFDLNVDGKPQRATPWFDENGQLHHLSKLGERFVKKGVGGTGAGPQPRAIKTWKKPDGTVVNLPNNVLPPKGSVQYKDPRMIKKDLASAEEKIIANMDNPASEPHIKFFNENSDASYFYMFDPGKKEGIIRDFFGSSDDKTTKIQLPIIKGKQTTLKDLRETAKLHNKTLEQVLREYAEKQKGKK